MGASAFFSCAASAVAGTGTITKALSPSTFCAAGAATADTPAALTPARLFFEKKSRIRFWAT
jgi:hypothetical protein